MGTVLRISPNRKLKIVQSAYRVTKTENIRLPMNCTKILSLVRLAILPANIVNAQVVIRKQDQQRNRILFWV